MNNAFDSLDGGGLLTMVELSLYGRGLMNMKSSLNELDFESIVFWVVIMIKMTHSLSRSLFLLSSMCNG